MSDTHLPNDPSWPRAAHWFVPVASAQASEPADVGLLGVPAWRSSITPTGAHATPAAVRDALLRCSTYAASREIDLASLRAIDFGDVADPDGENGEARTGAAVAAAARSARLLIAVGGDNSIAYSVMRGLAGDDLSGFGLITLDAHHDLRDGVSNGSPVRRLIEAGLPGANVVQIGIADFANSAAYAQRARDLGITVVPRAALRRQSPAEAAREALALAGAGGRAVYVDIDVDVCDRAIAPGCPSAVPGGLAADELREFAFELAADPRVRAIDITEVDATSDALDQRTVRLAALLVLEAAAGYAARGGAGFN
ncbi:MAG TPA: arginase family protein [Coriobacteriia bacterium]